MILSSGKVMFSGLSVCLFTCQRVFHVTITHDVLDLTVQRFLARNLAFLTLALTAQEPSLPCTPAQPRNLTSLDRNHQPLIYHLVARLETFKTCSLEVPLPSWCGHLVAGTLPCWCRHLVATQTCMVRKVGGMHPIGMLPC